MRFAIRSLLCLSLLIGLAAACAGRRELRGVQASGLDRKLSTFAFIEEGDLVTLIVDARATRERENDGFIPLEICVGNRGLRNVTLRRESFTLVDQEGNRYPCVGPRDLLSGYEYLDFDRHLAELAAITASRFANFTRYPSMFSPTREVSTEVSTLVRDSVSIPQFGYIVDFIYFPTPKTGVMNRRFELFLEAPELPDPVFVKFIVQ